MNKLTIFLLTIGVTLCSSTTPVGKCPHTHKDLFKSVTIRTPEGVCTKLPCIIKAGEDVKTDVSFLVREEVKEITLNCNVTVLGQTGQYPLPNATKGCEMLTNTTCPIKSDTEADLTFGMQIPRDTPEISAALTIYMVDQDNEMISCFQVFITIVDETLHLFKNSEN